MILLELRSNHLFNQLWSGVGLWFEFSKPASLRSLYDWSQRCNKMFWFLRINQQNSCFRWLVFELCTQVFVRIVSEQTMFSVNILLSFSMHCLLFISFLNSLRKKNGYFLLIYKNHNILFQSCSWFWEVSNDMTVLYIQITNETICSWLFVLDLKVWHILKDFKFEI